MKGKNLKVKETKIARNYMENLIMNGRETQRARDFGTKLQTEQILSDGCCMQIQNKKDDVI